MSDSPAPKPARPAQRSHVTWVCDLCGRTVECPAYPDSKLSTPDGWVVQHVASEPDRSRLELNTSSAVFCSSEHRVAWQEAGTRAKKVADIAANEVLTRVFREEMRKAKNELRSAVDRLGDLGCETPE